MTTESERFVQRKTAMREYANAHFLLIPVGFTVTYPGFGKPAQELLRVIQKHAGLRVTGKWNAEVHNLLFPPTMRERLVSVETGEVGTKETPPDSNSGPRVHVYQSSTGAYGQPWCASFQKWSLEKVGCKNLSHASADVTTWMAYPHVTHEAVIPGDHVIYRWGVGDVDHIGMFDGWDVKGHTFYAIEGNTGVGNDANGGEVMRRLHTCDSTVAAFVRVL